VSATPTTHITEREENVSELTENQRAWVQALRSGEYKQTKGVLAKLDEETREPLGFCCLGVACDLAVKAGLSITVNEDGFVRRFDGSIGSLPPSVQQWLGVTDQSPYWNPDDGGSLAEQNDDGATFAEIADFIEQHADSLFVREPSS
jgi:hypothetical protein